MGRKIRMYEKGDYEIIFEAPSPKFNAITGSMIDEQNGVDLGGTPKDFCLQCVYMFGVSAASYILNKRPANLSKFLVRYEHLTDLSGFTIPSNVDKSKLKELSVMANVVLMYAKLIALEKRQDATKKSPYEGFIPDLYEMFVDMFPKYSNKRIDYKEEVLRMASKFLQEANHAECFSNEKICEVWACSLAVFMCEDEKLDKLAASHPGFMEALFSLPLSSFSISKYMGYAFAVDRYSDKKTFYNDCVAPNIRKSKTLTKVYEEIQANNLERARKQVAEVCKNNNIDKKNKKFTSKIDSILDEYSETLDKFSEEIVSILTKNGYDLFSDISKNDILLAMQVRGAFGVYNGEKDKKDINKLIADVTISVLSRKYKELLAKSDDVSNKPKEARTSYDDKLNELTKTIDKLRVENQELHEKVSSSSNKDNRKETRIQALEEKVSNLNLEKDFKDSEIKALRKQIEMLESQSIKNEEEKGAKKDYKEILNSFAKDNKVILVGGHPSLISKIKTIFKDITFILENEKSKITLELIKNATIVLYKTDSISHSTWWCSSSKCKNFGTPEGYIGHVTNVDALAKSICESIESTLDIKM